MKFLILNGPSLHLLGIREPEIYGEADYRALTSYVKDECRKAKIKVTIKQSNHEGDLIDAICQAYGKYDAIVINPGAYTHTSIALADALRAVSIPCAEVHLSDINQREDYRKISYVGEVCKIRCMGKGFESYKDAITALCAILQRQS